MAVMSAADGAIIRGAQATKEAREDMAQRISTVQGHVEQLSSGKFAGASAVAFAKLMAQWNAESKSVNDALQGFEDSLRAQQQHLDQGEQDQSSSFAAIAANRL